MAHVRPMASLLALGLLSCDGSPARPGSRIHLVQEIHDVRVDVALESCPPQAIVHIAAAGGACDRLLPAEVVRDGAELRVRVRVETPPVVCTQELVGHELDVRPGFLPPGRYAVTVEGESGRITREFAIPEC